MPQMSDLFSSGHVVDLILAVMVLEILILAIFPGGPNRRKRVSALISAGLPGVFLLLGLRAALTGEAWYWVGLWLTASFPVHLADVWHRTR